VGQSALCFSAGRSSRFIQLFAVIQSCRGEYFIFHECLSILFFIRFYKASISVTYLAITVNTIWFCDEDFSSSICSLCFSVSGVCLFRTLHFLNWVCWVRGNFSGEPGRVYISCAYLSSVWSGGPVQFIWVLRWCGRRDCTDFPFSLALQWRVRHGRIGEGGGPFFFAFFSLLSVFLAVVYLR
jgi:hypothetical protein